MVKNPPAIAGHAGSIPDPTCSGVTKLHTTSEPTRSNEEPVCAARAQHSHSKPEKRNTIIILNRKIA